ncbi:hypothetical protein EMCRGX_G006369 [Ephydatia muelleri]
MGQATQLLSAAYDGDIATVRRLVTEGHVDMNVTDERVSVSILTLPNSRLPLSGGLAWTFPMVLAAHCALRLPWTHLAIMLLPAKGVVMLFLTTTNYMLSFHTCPADLLFPNWVLGKSAAFDLSVTSPLNPTIILEARVTTGASARTTEQRKHCSNDAKCDEVAWVCVPLVGNHMELGERRL